MLRDILTRQEPLVFKPGQFYVLTALAGAVVLVFFTVELEMDATLAALAAIGSTFLFRVLTIAFNGRTTPVGAPVDGAIAPSPAGPRPAG